MMSTTLILFPLVMAAVASAWPSERTRPWLLPLTGVPHTVVAFWLLLHPPVVRADFWLGLDSVARSVAPMVSLLFLVCAAYSVPYLGIRIERGNRVYIGALLALFGLLNLAMQAQNLGLLWVAVEGATLTAVPLLHFNRTARALEATWKYLLVGGTGIALSLLGSFALGYASLHGGGDGDLSFASLAAQGADLSRPWVAVAWTLLLVGYGTKMGLAPMHTWKPDAYGEAPGVIGALLAGGVTTVAFVGLLRVKQVVDASGASAMTERTLMGIGLFSMVVAALFLLGSSDVKRVLAYSSIEHMGVLAIGAAIGGAGLWAALYHVWTNGLTKGGLFLLSGNLHRLSGGRTVEEIGGMAWRAPITSRLFIVGVLAVTSIPPFGLFFSELALLRAALADGRGVVASIFLGCLLMAFLGLSRFAFAIHDGRPTREARGTVGRFRESFGIVFPPAIFLALSIWLGLAPPEALRDTWTAAVAMLSTRP